VCRVATKPTIKLIVGRVWAKDNFIRETTPETAITAIGTLKAKIVSIGNPDHQSFRKINETK
jgi:hypothetical protein